MKARLTSVLLLSLTGILMSLSAMNSAPVDSTEMFTSTKYLPTARANEVCDTCEPNNGLSQTCGPLAPGQSYQYPIRCLVPPNLDVDVYHIDLEATGTITIDLTSIPAGTDYGVSLHDQQGGPAVCSAEKPGNEDEQVLCKDKQPGRYYVQVFTRNGCNNNDPYTLKVTYPTPPPPPIPTPTPPPPCNEHMDDFGDTNPNNDLGGASTSGVSPSGCGAFSANSYGFDLQLNYNLNALGCTARYTTTLPALNTSLYQILAFEIKSSSTQELLDTVVGVRDLSGRTMTDTVGDFVPRAVVNPWQGVAVPLAVFDTQINASQLNALFIEFINKNQAPKQGTVYIDSLRLERPRVPLAVDNFNDRAAPNALGGVLTTYTSPGASITTTYVTTGAYDGSPASYAVSYAAPLYEYAVWDTTLSSLDVTGYDFLSFYIRGVQGGEKVNLYLDDGTLRHYVDVEAYAPVSTTWSLVNIPLGAFAGVNLTGLSKIQFAFEYEPMTGTIFLDDIRFEASPLLIDNFCDSGPDNEKVANNSLNSEVSVFTSASPFTGVVTPSLEAGTLRLNYDVTAGPSSFSGYFSKTPVDLNAYRSLTFNVRGERCGEFAAISARTAPIATDKIEISDYLLDGITDEWQEATIPLAAHTIVTDWTRGDSYVIAFEAGRGAAKGATWWDELSFTTTCEPLWVDNFNDEDDVNALVGHSNVFTETGAALTMTTPITQALGDAGASLALNYSVPPGTYAGWQTDLRDANLSDYEWLIFNVKSRSGGANPNIYLEDSTGTRGFINLEDYVTLTGEWQAVFVPLHDFGVNLTRVKYLQVVFEYEPKLAQGALMLDNIRFGCRLKIFLPLSAKATTPSLSDLSQNFVFHWEALTDPSAGPIWDFETGVQGWTHQTYSNSQAIIAVEPATFRSYSGNASLAVVMDLAGDHANQSMGEALVDLRYSPPLSVTAPVNLACKPISCRVFVPTCGLGDIAAPNRVQLFVKDANGKSEYGTPMQVVRNRWFDLSLRPSTLVPYNGWMDQGFNPAAINQLGVKFTAGSQQTSYRGKVYIDACSWQEIDPAGVASAGACVLEGDVQASGN